MDGSMNNFMVVVLILLFLSSYGDPSILQSLQVKAAQWAGLPLQVMGWGN